MHEMREIIKGGIVLVLTMIALYFLMADVRNRNNYVYYDCTMASFHPDIPPKVKEACRLRTAHDQDMQQRAEQEKLNKK
jgi:hypothetical protein